MKIKCAEYVISYEGGRLATVEINGYPVEGVPVRGYGSHGFTEPEPTEAQVREKVEQWIDPEDMVHYRESARASADAQRAHERECTDPRCMCGKRRT